MFAQQKVLLYSLSCSHYYREKLKNETKEFNIRNYNDAVEFYDSIANEIYFNDLYKSQVKFLQQDGFINEKGNLTSKGFKFLEGNASAKNSKELGIDTLFNIVEQDKRGEFRASLSFYKPDLLNNILTHVVEEIQKRMSEGTMSISTESIVAIENLLLTFVDQNHLEEVEGTLELPVQIADSEEIEAFSQPLVEQPVEVKAKKTRKTKI